MSIYTQGRSITQECGELIASLFTKARSIHKKGIIDLVTDADIKCEKMFIEKIQKNYPSHAILSEERGNVPGDADHLWIIDPIDGTTNYARMLPFFCVSVAYAYKRQPQFGFVYAPLMNQFFEAEIGKGAFLNGDQIKVSPHTDLSDCFLTTGFPYNIREEKHYDNISLFSHFSKNSLAVRRLGSAALDLCYVACGIFDGYWELKLHPWDFAAGNLICSEAGGLVSDFSRNQVQLEDSEILATNSKIHELMLKDIQRIHAQKID